MHVIRRRGWEIPERLATPEHLFINRRAFLAAGGASALALSPTLARAQRVTDLPDPTKDLYPAKHNDKFTLDRPVTDEKVNTSYNNFYEFGSSKTIAKAAQALKLRPVDDQDRRHGREAAGDRHRRSHPQDDAGGAPLPSPLRRGVVDGGSVVRLSAGEAGRTGEAAVVGEIFAHGDVPRSEDRARPAPDLVSVALCRGADDRRGDERTRFPGDRRLRQAGLQADGCADPARAAVEVWLQVSQVDRALQLHRPAAEELLGIAAGRRIRLLGQRESARCRIRAGVRRARN